jgi:hypothetical protein
MGLRPILIMKQRMLLTHRKLLPKAMPAVGPKRRFLNVRFSAASGS